ncbi:PorP/SprF family type IX secretion system membrane protein [Xanthocytophaga agilis]|uniref:PorP/SprF family type IX secretion system membrane protein n=1 Tax=Xanthocytophaga agilis TaxID=3048010 RepID=A0AAE3RE58_9BACT|nr:PorP/SprF family type IX secretion system membrane protein [Xanthocytophaga agilis]MDJ1506542.1 PorP/SprF family type IX secretion system membrane protein [Xanthocytophaga agilis]
MKSVILLWSQITISVSILLLGGISLQAQVLSPNPNYYIHTFNNLYQLNPAMAGSNDELTGFITYHQQVLSGFEDTPRHLSLSVDAPFTRSQQVAFGGNIYTFRRSIMQTTGLSGTFARKLILGKDSHTLRLGVTGGFFYNAINPDGVNLADPAIARLNGKFQPDLAFGVNYQIKSFQLGVAFPKMLSFATIDQSGDRNTSALKINTFSSQLFYALYDFEINERWTIRPLVIYRSMADAVSGLEVNARVLYNDKFWFGGTFRQEYGNAAFVGYKAKKLSIGYAYKLANAQQYNYSNPAHEIQLGLYLGKLGKSKQSIARGGARLNISDDFVAGRVRKSRSASPANNSASSKLPMAKAASTSKQMPSTENESEGVKLETIHKGSSAEDLNIGNYLVIGSFDTKEKAERELINSKEDLKDQPYTPKIGFNSLNRTYYLYLASGKLQDLIRVGTDLKAQDQFENLQILRIIKPSGK